jgi:hypothetical protein
MKRILLLAALALALPTAVFADSSIDYANVGGTLTASAGSNPTLTLSGSQLIGITGIPSGTSITGSNLGSVSFTTGALTSGSLALGGMFAAGGTFTITGNGMNGAPTGTIFTGTFSGPLTLALMTNTVDGTHTYTLSGTLSGMTASGFTTTGSTVQLTVSTGLGYFDGSVILSSGDTNVVVPEPGSLVLLGTGLIGLAGVVRRKLKA